jgi:hypothetical protein
MSQSLVQINIAAFTLSNFPMKGNSIASPQRVRDISGDPHVAEGFYRCDLPQQSVICVLHSHVRTNVRMSSEGTTVASISPGRLTAQCGSLTTTRVKPTDSPRHCGIVHHSEYRLSAGDPFMAWTQPIHRACAIALFACSLLTAALSLLAAADPPAFHPSTQPILAPSAERIEDKNQRDARMAWWRDARFGMSIR